MCSEIFFKTTNNKKSGTFLFLTHFFFCYKNLKVCFFFNLCKWQYISNLIYQQSKLWLTDHLSQWERSSLDHNIRETLTILLATQSVSAHSQCHNTCTSTYVDSYVGAQTNRLLCRREQHIPTTKQQKHTFSFSYLQLKHCQLYGM